MRSSPEFAEICPCDSASYALRSVRKYTHRYSENSPDFHPDGCTPVHDNSYGACFAIGGRTRTEIYIDRGDASENKSIFDKFAQAKAALEEGFGKSFEWERLDEKKASRIAVYREGSIEDDPQLLKEVRDWFIECLLRLKKVFGPEIEKLVKQGDPRRDDGDIDTE